MSYEVHFCDQDQFIEELGITFHLISDTKLPGEVFIHKHHGDEYDIKKLIEDMKSYYSTQKLLQTYIIN